MLNNRFDYTLVLYSYSLLQKKKGDCSEFLWIFVTTLLYAAVAFWNQFVLTAFGHCSRAFPFCECATADESASGQSANAIKNLSEFLASMFYN